MKNENKTLDKINMNSYFYIKILILIKEEKIVRTINKYDYEYLIRMLLKDTYKSNKIFPMLSSYNSVTYNYYHNDKTWLYDTPNPHNMYTICQDDYIKLLQYINYETNTNKIQNDYFRNLKFFLGIYCVLIDDIDGFQKIYFIKDNNTYEYIKDFIYDLTVIIHWAICNSNLKFIEYGIDLYKKLFPQVKISDLLSNIMTYATYCKDPIIFRKIYYLAKDTLDQLRQA